MLPFDEAAIGTAAFKASPWQTYARLRAENPVCRVRLPNGEHAVIVTRYDDVSALLKDSRLIKNPANAPSSSDKRREPPRIFRPLTRNMLSLDDPDHARLKRLVQAAFTPRRVETLIVRTQEVSTALLDKLSGVERFDLIADYAMPLPVTVISDLLGIPVADQQRFARWSRALISAGTTRMSLLLALPQMLAFLRYLRRLIAMKQAAPDGALVSALVHDAAEDRLDAEELMAMIAILVSAGHETTTNFIGNGMLALLLHPAKHERLAAGPALIEPAVEELLRFAGPVELSTPRFAREDLTIAGAAIPAGTQVFGVLASANRDPARFANPESLDIGREQNRHLTFGEGGHYCVGAALARMEGRVAFADLLFRLGGLQLDIDPTSVRWRPHLVLRGLKQLPVRSTPKR